MRIHLKKIVKTLLIFNLFGSFSCRTASENSPPTPKGSPKKNSKSNNKLSDDFVFLIGKLLRSQEHISNHKTKGKVGVKRTDLSNIKIQLEKTRKYSFHIQSSQFNFNYDSSSFVRDNLETLFKNISINKYPRNLEPFEILPDKNHFGPDTRRNHNGVNHLMQYFLGKMIFKYFKDRFRQKYDTFFTPDDEKLIEIFMFSKILTRVDEKNGLESCLFVENDKNLNFLAEFLDIEKLKEFHTLASGSNCMPTASVTSALFANLLIKHSSYLNKDLTDSERKRRTKFLSLITLAMITYHPGQTKEWKSLSIYNWVTDQGHYIDHCRMGKGWTQLYKDPYWMGQWREHLELDDQTYDIFSQCVYGFVDNIYKFVNREDNDFSKSKKNIEQIMQQFPKNQICNNIRSYKKGKVEDQQNFMKLHSKMSSVLEEVSSCLKSL